MKKYYISFLVLIKMIIISLQVQASPAPKTIWIKAISDTLPVPKNIKNLLFYVQRDPNTNTVIYELNLKPDGKINENEPIKIYWIRYAEKGIRRDLNYFQRKLAYGLNVKKISPGNYEFQFVCYSKLTFRLSQDQSGKYHVYTNLNQNNAIVNRVFARINGGSFWVPNVEYVDIFGKEVATGKEVRSRIMP